MTGTINWSRVLEWLHDHLVEGETSVAEKGSISVKYGVLRVPHGLFLLSVSKACVVPINGPKGPPYAALSYVWGDAEHELTASTANFQELQVPGRLQKGDVPLLVKDAMSVCSRIGLEYFWVDRLCVVQDDLGMKLRQLEAMGQIYSEASVTLVSPDRDGARLGLYGLSRPRTPQLVADRGPITLVDADLKGYVELYRTTWFERGWTFQEAFYSQRLLLFAQNMVYMLRRGNDRLTRNGCEGLQKEPPPIPPFC